MAIEKQKCLRCGWEWYPRNPDLPLTCPNPKCHSPYWNRPRKSDNTNETIKQ